ncbi:hypothetical protein [Paenibacillus sp.]|jgi:hypothetical protein|uniref:hypothetical protein n=1 Tax=Paenibacillus sp. TaxID=58172 RepID=UPI00283A9DDD|nr:hypothetical protein [Paenibacillus sp.]
MKNNFIKKWVSQKVNCTPSSSEIDAKVHLFTTQRLDLGKKLAKVQAFSFF